MTYTRFLSFLHPVDGRVLPEAGSVPVPDGVPPTHIADLSRSPRRLRDAEGDNGATTRDLPPTGNVAHHGGVKVIVPGNVHVYN